MRELKKHKKIYPFLTAVDEVEDDAPDYYTIIEDPIDISIIEFKLKNHIYTNPSLFHADL